MKARPRSGPTGRMLPIARTRSALRRLAVGSRAANASGDVFAARSATEHDPTVIRSEVTVRSMVERADVDGYRGSATVGEPR